MNKQNSTASGDRPGTVQEMHDISQGVGVYVQFNVVGLDEIDQLVRKHKNLTLELEQNAERMRSVLWGLNVQFRENRRGVIDQKLIVVRTGYEKVLNGFLTEMQAQRREKVEKTGIEGFTEFEALMPELIRFILPDRKCRIVLEYDPEASSVELRREVTEAEQV